MTTAAAQVQCPGAVTGPGPVGPRVAVLLPAYNEALAIGAVIEAFRASLPEATIYVYDNNSRDATAEIARAAGAVVRSER
uniref:glycosyltransferase n=1 Tax=Novosphingobium huizhouense TaxID=2866625 RepID=UPI001CD9025E